MKLHLAEPHPAIVDPKVARARFQPTLASLPPLVAASLALLPVVHPEIDSLDRAKPRVKAEGTTQPSLAHHL
jgi:hypothetical protein